MLGLNRILGLWTIRFRSGYSIYRIYGDQINLFQSIVLILNGNSEIDAHVFSEIGNSIILRIFLDRIVSKIWNY